MMEKVIITKGQAKTLDEMVAENWEKRAILKGHLNAEYIPWEKYEALNNMPFDDLVTALYIGYEVEPSPEEYVSERYEKAKMNVKGDIHPEYNQGVVDAIEMVLRTLKIKIERVHK